LESLTGYNEKLTIEIEVYQHAPDWQVDEENYSSSMNIISQLKIKNAFSSDNNDMIAVFHGEICRGVANIEYNTNYDDYFAFITIYGNNQTEELEYKIWDASEGKIYSDITPVLDYIPNQLYGTMAEPII